MLSQCGPALTLLPARNALHFAVFEYEAWEGGKNAIIIKKKSLAEVRQNLWIVNGNSSCELVINLNSFS